jgi:mannose-6-phosphate isomerase
MLYPLTFQPIFKERVWGGRQLVDLYQKELPSGAVIGESWEISDRPGDASVISNGTFAGKDLRWLMEHEADDLIGSAHAPGDRFPLLIKLLDAQDKLSLQVHPPARVAAQLGGEPKTEMWYVAAAAPGAELYVGMRRGISRANFELRLATGQLEGGIHRIKVRRGDVLFLPSGRFHAIGAGLVIFEIQQNSDTTYRVFDWNRKGLDGQLRELHVPQALASIDFDDYEPGLVTAPPVAGPNFTTRALVNDPLFRVNEVVLSAGDYHLPRVPKPQIIGVVAGEIVVRGGMAAVPLRAGQFCLVPACLRTACIQATTPATFLTTAPA